MKVVFFLLWALILLFFQVGFRFQLGNFVVNFDFLTTMVIYVGFTLPLFSGLITVLVVSILMSAFSIIPQEMIILVNLIIFVSIRFLIEQIYSEAYLTKSIWVFLFSLLSLYLRSEDRINLLSIFSQALVNGILSFPLFIVWDKTFFIWLKNISIKRADFSGADFFQVKNTIRKYVKW